MFRMRLSARGWMAALMLFTPLTSFAVTCTTQGELQPQDRNALAGFGQRLTDAIVQQDYSTLQAQLLPAIQGQWNGIRGEVELGAPLLKGGHAELQNIYLLDASTQTETTDDQFFCSNSSGSITVTISMHALPPGKYAVILASGEQPQATWAAWQWVWASALDRLYTADFDEYIAPGDVRLHVAVR